MDKKIYQKMSIIEKVMDYKLFEDLYFCDPFLCKLILDEFKTYLADPSFDKLERQLLLMKFLKTNYPIEVSREVIEYVQNSKYADDYTKIILEWNYNNSDFIRRANVVQYDSLGLALNNDELMYAQLEQQNLNKQLDLVTDITSSLLAMRREDDYE